MSFLWYRGGLSLLLESRSLFWYRDLHSLFQHQDSRSSSSWDRPVRVFWASPSCKLELNKDLDAEKDQKVSIHQKDVSIPTKSVPCVLFFGLDILQIGGQ